MVIWVYKIISRGRIEKRQLCRSQIIVKMRGCHKQLTAKAGDRHEGVTVKTVLTVLKVRTTVESCMTSFNVGPFS